MSTLPPEFWAIITKHHGLAYADYVRDAIINGATNYRFVDLWFTDKNRITACLAELATAFKVSNSNSELVVGDLFVYPHMHAVIEINGVTFELTLVWSPFFIPVDFININAVTYDGKEIKGPVEDVKAHRFHILPSYKAAITSIMVRNPKITYDELVTQRLKTLGERGYTHVVDLEIMKDLETLKPQTGHHTKSD